LNPNPPNRPEPIAPTGQPSPATPTESIVLGGGCFWCLDAAYRLLPGVTRVTCGYAGGAAANPTYEEVCRETTGHAEVVKIEWAPARSTLDQIMEVFWHVHDPTQVGGQGNDHGRRYRSIILYADAGQRDAAEAACAAAARTYTKPLTTEIKPLEKFWPAEDYHQDYFAQHPDQGYCAWVIAPKVRKVEKLLGKAT
jgi:peptide-methionine (S)-S-oxide reductase